MRRRENGWKPMLAAAVIALTIAQAGATLPQGGSSSAAAGTVPRVAFGAGWTNRWGGSRFLGIEIVEGMRWGGAWYEDDTGSYRIRLTCFVFSKSPSSGRSRVQASGNEFLNPSKRFYILVIDGGPGHSDIVEVLTVKKKGPCGADSAGHPAMEFVVTPVPVRQ